MLRNMHEVFAEWKKDAADSLLKFQPALNADATLFMAWFLKGIILPSYV